MEELWADVPDAYTRRYQVSNLGRIRSSDFTFTHPGPGRMAGQIITRKGAMMKPSMKARYPKFMPTLKCGKRKDVFIHHMVAEVFIGPRPEGMWVLHKDGDYGNSAELNLYYGTPSQNTFDAYNHKSLKRGEDHHKTKLSDVQVFEILHGKDSLLSTARKFNVSKKLVLLIRQKKTRRHITCPEGLALDYLRHGHEEAA